MLDTHEAFSDDRVRAEMMRQFGYFVTESTPHNSEYLPYFNRTKELLDHYGVGSRAPIPMENTRVRDWMKDSGGRQDGDGDVPPLAASHEYASMIIEARLTGRPFAFNGNVMNHGSITNLRSDATSRCRAWSTARGFIPPSWDRCRRSARP